MQHYKYPYTNLNDLNLDKILSMLGEVTGYHDDLLNTVEGKISDLVESGELPQLISDEIYRKLREPVNKDGLYTDFNKVYVSNLTGSDENDGLSAETAFRSMERAMEELNHGKSDLRIYILTAGVYPITKPVLTSCALHIVAEVNGVELAFSNPDYSWSVYNSHVNIQCRDANGYITISAPNSFRDYENQVIYFENCVTTFSRVIFHSYYRLDIFGGAFTASNWQLYGQLVASYAVCDLNNTLVTCPRSDVYAIGALYGATLSFRGSIEFRSLNGRGLGVASNAVRLQNATMISTVYPQNELSRKYYNAIFCHSSQIIMAEARYNLWNSRLGQYLENDTAILNGTLLENEHHDE